LSQSHLLSEGSAQTLALGGGGDAEAPPHRRGRVRSALRSALLIVVVGGALGAGVPSVRTPVLRAAGAALVASDAVIPADIIVVATGADGAGVLEAADLVHAGVATRVAVFADPPDPVVDREFLRRGVPYENAARRSLRQLRSLGIDAVEEVPRAVAGSDDESRVIPEWCRERGLRSVVVVTTADHSRRLRRLLRRSMKGQAAAVAVRAARFSQFDPETWWQTREGTRVEVIELQKLLLDVVLHPLS
jgi:hypothetical protein